MTRTSGLNPAAGMRLDRRLLHLVRTMPVQAAFLAGISLSVGATIAASSWLLSQIVASAFLQNAPLSDLQNSLFILILLAAVRATLIFGRGLFASKLSIALQQSIRRKLASKLTHLGPSYSRQFRTGELISILADGIDALDPYFRLYLPQLATTALIPLLILLVVFPLDPLSGWVLLLTAPLIPFFMILIGRSANQRLQAHWQQLQATSAVFLERLQGMATLKVLGRSSGQLERIKAISDQFRRSTLSVLRIAFLSALVLELAAAISTAIIAVQIGLRLLNGNLSFQVGFFILLLAPEFYLPMRSLGAHFHDSVTGLAAADDIFKILNAKEDAQPGQFLSQGRPPDDLGSIHFDRVVYQYPGRNQPALQNVSFAISGGERVILVGPSGAGKSTLLQLLLRFLEPDKGEIRINGQSLAQFNAAVWRQQIAWVPQQPFLLHGSLLDNIRLGNPKATTAQIEEAAENAGLMKFVRDLPLAFQTHIGERGFRLSGGQAQRVALARAFLRRAPLLLLDEPTANLDPATEASILEAMRDLTANGTTLWISHRLHNAFEADRIVLISNGRLLEAGPPLDLLEADGSFAKLAGSAGLKVSP
ncbi:MAG: thiol reductant ABC exporter subunit CydD [Anaerolineales bacterium]